MTGRLLSSLRRTTPTRTMSSISTCAASPSNKGDDEHALSDYDLCLQMRPNFAPAYNNRGLIFMRRGDLQRAFDEINIALSLNAPASRYINLFNRGRVQTLRKQYEPALADFEEARQLNPEGWQIPNYRCITYTELGRFDEAIADCNEVLAKYPKWVGPITNRG